MSVSVGSRTGTRGATAGQHTEDTGGHAYEEIESPKFGMDVTVELKCGGLHVASGICICGCGSGAHAGRMRRACARGARCEPALDTPRLSSRLRRDDLRSFPQKPRLAKPSIM